MDDDGALAVLRKRGEAELANERVQGRLRAGPEPGRAEVEPVRRRVPGRVNRQDTTAQPLAGLKEPEDDACTVEATGCCQPRQAAADDKDRIGHEQFEFRDASVVVAGHAPQRRQIGAGALTFDAVSTYGSRMTDTLDKALEEINEISGDEVDGECFGRLGQTMSRQRGGPW